MNQALIAIVGPTATGKTRLGVALAQRLAPAELLNADSRQLRDGPRVATFVPGTAELEGVTCHLLGLAAPGEPFSVADWLTRAHDVLVDLRSRGVRPIVIGGSGLYVRALVDGYTLAGVPPDPVGRRRRSRLEGTAEGRRALAAELSRRDPGAAARVDLRNPRRVIRALEILDAGRDAAAVATPASMAATVIGLDVEPDVHRHLIRHRIDTIFRDGSLLEEVEQLRAAGVSANALAASGIGYDEALALLAGDIDVATAIDLTVTRTLRYAKAQRTWFRADPRIHWLRPDRLAFGPLVDAAAGLVDCATAQS